MNYLCYVLLQSILCCQEKKFSSRPYFLVLQYRAIKRNLHFQFRLQLRNRIRRKYVKKITYYEFFTSTPEEPFVLWCKSVLWSIVLVIVMSNFSKICPNYSYGLHTYTGSTKKTYKQTKSSKYNIFGSFSKSIWCIKGIKSCF